MCSSGQPIVRMNGVADSVSAKVQLRRVLLLILAAVTGRPGHEPSPSLKFHNHGEGPFDS